MRQPAKYCNCGERSARGSAPAALFPQACRVTPRLRIAARHKWHSGHPVSYAWTQGQRREKQPLSTQADKSPSMSLCYILCDIEGLPGDRRQLYHVSLRSFIYELLRAVAPRDRTQKYRQNPNFECLASAISPRRLSSNYQFKSWTQRTLPSFKMMCKIGRLAAIR